MTHFIRSLRKLLSVLLIGAVMSAAAPDAAVLYGQESESSSIAVTPYMVETAAGRGLQADWVRLVAPQNRAAPDDRALVEVPFVRFRTTAEDPKPPLFVVSAGLDNAPVLPFDDDWMLSFVALYGDRADVIFAGLRGTGQSRPLLRCPGSYEPALGQPLSLELLLERLDLYYSTCAGFWQEAGIDLASYNAAAMAADIDDARRLLGYETISLLGIDFGAHVGMELMRSRTDTIARAVFAAAPGFDQMMHLPTNADAALQLLAERLQTSPQLAARIPDFLGLVQRLLARLDTQPVTVQLLDPATREPVSVTVGKYDLQHVIVQALSSHAQQELPARLFEMEQGDFSWLAARAYALRTAVDRSLVPLAVRCSSGASDARRQEVETAAQTAILGNTGNRAEFGLCNIIGAPDLGAEFRDPLAVETPILLINGSLDPLTPPSEATALLTGLANGQQLTVDGVSRDLFETAFAQLASAISDFLFAEEPLLPAASVSVPSALEPIDLEPITGFTWEGQYYNNRDLQGDPIRVIPEADINFSWGEGSPFPEIGFDNFSVRWVASRQLAAGAYSFHLSADDGVRLWIDDVLVIDHWLEGGAHNTKIGVNLVAGIHTVRMEYFEAEGLALAQLNVIKLNSYPDWKAEYLTNPALQGEPAVLRNEKSVDHVWGAQPPVSGVPADNFSARWSKAVDLDAGTYEFAIETTGAVRLWLDGQLLIDSWTLDAARILTGQSPALAAGPHDLRIEYAKGVGGGALRLRWTKNALAAEGPTATVTALPSGSTGQPLTFDGGISTPGSTGQIVTYGWDFGDGTIGDAISVDHTYAAPGFYNVTLTVTNDEGASDSTSIQVRIDDPQATAPAPQPPVAQLAGAAQGVAGDPVEFDGSQSTASNPLLRFEWSFGDGTTADTVRFSKLYDAPGLYEVTLTVRDTEGQSSSASRLVQIFAGPSVIVPDLAPTPTPLPPAGPPVSLVPTAVPALPTTSDIQPTQVPLQGEVPGQAPPTVDPALQPPGTEPTPTVTPNTAVSPPPPSILTFVDGAMITPVFGPTGPTVTVPLNKGVTFDGSNSQQGTYPITSFYWRLNADGSTSNEPVIAIVYNEPGQFNIDLTVSDSIGLTATTVLTVIVQAETP